MNDSSRTQIIQRLNQASREALPGAMIWVEAPGFPAPIYLRPRTTDAHIFMQIFVDKELAFPLDDPPGVIVDAGANIGLHDRFKPGCTAAVERAVQTVGAIVEGEFNIIVDADIVSIELSKQFSD